MNWPARERNNMEFKDISGSPLSSHHLKSVIVVIIFFYLAGA